MKKTVFLFFIIFHTCLFSQNIDREITDRYVKENIAVLKSKMSLPNIEKIWVKKSPRL